MTTPPDPHGTTWASATWVSATWVSATWVNLASRALGASVVAANDESFGEKENLVVDAPAAFVPGRYGHKGELVDGWETRRRRGPDPRARPGEPAEDWTVVRLAAPGTVREVDVDTTSFTGNPPARARVEACRLPGYPSPAELLAADWTVLVPDTALAGDAHHVIPVAGDDVHTHVRLVVAPDGGVARLRVRGVVRPEPERFVGQTLDLAAAELGGVVEACSDAFYGTPDVLLLPGVARTMGEGWETRRRRDDGHDWVVVRLAARGTLRELEVDTGYYVCNASGAAALAGRDGDGPWREVMPATRLQPDTRHRFDLGAAGPFTHVRLEVHPDGGLSRLRVRGRVAAADLEPLRRAWTAR
jgi:allantoicase